MSGITDLLYHTTLAVHDKKGGLSSGHSRSVYVLGTHSTLAAAKAFAVTSLHGLGYEPGDFTEYAVHDGKTAWKYGDGVVVYAKAPAGQEFFVGIDTTPNQQEFAAGPNGTILLSAYPDDNDPTQHLHYVVQTEVDYDQERGSDFKAAEIEGCFLHRADAIDAAKVSLKNAGYEFARYDERPNLEPAADWPFGEEVLVHAVSQTGENYEVAVRTIPGTHKKHAKKNVKASA
ncbi:hypothetical protein F503_06167 [Ophiostoma piceae UAMH 11346]|uniref:Uncharacterized protein n=1 Tax=Ophiostoma piceae (strain UAMH 11346) TaxID=1262450 RepID=S3CE49_OPHP1|nr:hypothetical protein F503_06167 [Ophiostoma piceae UAMH 11346]